MIYIYIFIGRTRKNRREENNMIKMKFKRMKYKNNTMRILKITLNNQQYNNKNFKFNNQIHKSFPKYKNYLLKWNLDCSLEEIQGMIQFKIR